jgi:malate dehydrogenase (oxaloacetate-decarboxylating)(NADP+)
VAAKALAEQVDTEVLDRGTIYPPLRDIYGVSVAIAAEVAKVAYRAGLARAPEPLDFGEHLRSMKYDPRY